MEKIIVIGAGLVGAALAHRLAEAGHPVTVLDAGPVAGQASGRSFGWINASFYLTTAHFHLRHAAMAAHRRLMAQPGLPPLHRFPGCLWWEAQGGGLDRAQAELAALGYPCQRIEARAIALAEPALARPPQAALHLPAEGAVEADALARSLLAHPGIRTLTGMPAQLALGQGRVVGVDTPLGRIAADQVVLASGTGTPDLLRPLGLNFAMQHRPGLLLRTRPVDFTLRHILAAPDQEIRQDGQNRLIAPAVAAHQGDSGQDLTAPETMAAETLGRIENLFGITGLQVESLTHALRPVPGDGLPAIGPVPGAAGLWLSVMHSGVTLAPLAAELLAAEIAGQPASALLATFRPDRLITAL